MKIKLGLQYDVSPRTVSFISAGIMALLFSIIALSYYLNFSITEPTLVILILGSIFFLISFFIVHTVIQNFIYSKIKLIYKTIHSLKKADEDIDFSSGNFLKQVNKDVISWSQAQKNEIKTLQDRETFRREYVGNLAHELRTPLTVAQGNVQTLFEGAVDNPDLARKFLERAAKGIDRMIALVQDMDSISKLESGIIKLEYSKFDVLKMCRELFDDLEEKAQERKVSLEFNKNYSKPIMVKADEGRIQQVFVNLIVNAINYSKQEGGKVDIRFYDLDESILIEVADNGIGIDSKELPRIFERFFRIDKSRSRQVAGSGLGLSICKHILEAHNKRINVRSVKGIGTTFSFNLEKA